MRIIGAGLQTHLEQEETTLAMCWKVKRTDGVLKGFTNHDVDIEYDLGDGDGSITYEASSGGTFSSVKASADLSVDNLDIEMILESSYLTDSDLRCGLYDNAEIWIFLINYENTALGVVKLSYGHLGDVDIFNEQARAEMRSLTQLLQQEVGRVYGIDCDAEFCDARCGKTASSFTTAGSVATCIDSLSFVDGSRTEDKGYFNYGKLTWTSGANLGLSMEVKSYATQGTFTLFQSMPYTISTGASYSVIAGCDKKYDTCKNTWSNLDNYRGFPHIPGQDEALRYPDAH